MNDVPYIDLHTHTHHFEVLCVVSYGIGTGQPFPEAPCVSAGVHPWDAERVDMTEAIRFLSTAKIAAIGEIGLDFSRQIDRDRQVDVFREQLAIAEKRNLPVILHCVKAYNEVLKTVSEFDLKAAVFHSYIGSPELASTITGKGYYISISERSLKSKKTIESISNTALGRIFAETDTSEVSIEHVYNAIAAIKKIEITELKHIIFNNFKKITE